MSSNASRGHNPAYLEAAKELRTNPEQWRAYESDGHCVVLAGPGSGKTKIITTKIARMLNEDVRPPRGLACITYSNECARELLRRLDKLGVRSNHNVFVGTVHSFCLQNILLPYGSLVGEAIPKPLQVATTDERNEIFGKAVEDVVGVYEKVSNWDFRCQTYRRKYIDRDAASWAESDSDAAKVIENYEMKLREAGKLDFDDIVLVGLRLVNSHEWIRKSVISRFPILVVDEYQDLGVALHHIVLTLCFKYSDWNARLLAVGDADQSIYGFTGANPGLLQGLANRVDVQVERLKLNYRSRNEIVRASKIAIGEKRDYESVSDDIGIIEFHECSDGAEQQAAIIANDIIPGVLESGAASSLGEIAVLYCTKHQGEAIATAIAEAGYDFIRIDGNAPYVRTPLTRWLEECAAWCAGGWRTGRPRISDIVSRWHGFLSSVTGNAARLEETRRNVSFLFGRRDANANFGEWLKDFSETCLNDSLGKEQIMRDETALLSKLVNLAAHDGVLSEWTVARFGGQGGSPTHVNLMTLHSAKGLEFDVVAMYCMDQGIIPSYRAKTPASKREPRRLFYVGMTRSRHEVHLVYSGWYVTSWGKVCDDGPSEFLLELQDRLNASEDSLS